MAGLIEYRFGELASERHIAQQKRNFHLIEKIDLRKNFLSDQPRGEALIEVGSLLVKHFVNSETDKAKLLVRTINDPEPNRNKTVTTGWLLKLVEVNQYDLEVESLAYSGLILNRSNRLFEFNQSEFLDNEIPTYRVSRYPQISKLSRPYPVYEPRIIGDLNELNYGNLEHHRLIESLFLEKIINDSIKIESIPNLRG